GVVAGEPPVPGNDVGRDLFVGRAEVRPAVHEIDRGGQEILHRSSHALCASAWTSLIGMPRSFESFARSSNSGCAFKTRPSRRATLNRTGPSVVVTVTISRSRHSRDSSWCRIAIVVHLLHQLT